MRRPIATAVLAGLAVAAIAAAPSWNERYHTAEQLYLAGQYLDASTVAEDALRIATSSLGPEHVLTAQTLVLLGNIHLVRDQPQRTLYYYQRALTILERRLGQRHLKVGEVALLLANYYLNRRDAKTALTYAQRALKIQETVYGATSPRLVDAWTVMAECYLGQGDSTRAEELYELASTTRASTNGKQDPGTRQLEARLTAVRQFHDHLESTAVLIPPPPLAQIEAPPEIESRASSDEMPRNPAGEMQKLGTMAHSFEERASAMLSIGNFSEARDLLLQAAAIYQKRLGASHPETLAAIKRYYGLLEKRGRPVEADEFMRRSKPAP